MADRKNAAGLTASKLFLTPIAAQHNSATTMVSAEFAKGEERRRLCAGEEDHLNAISTMSDILASL